MLLKIDLHTHTNIYSGCSILAPERLCELALERGLNGLAITEHHYQWQQSELAALQARFPALKLYAGVEISCLDGRDYVVLGLQGGAYQPMPYLQLEALLRRYLSPAVASLLAEPVRTEDGLYIDWCTTLAGQPVPLGSLPTDEQRRLRRVLDDRIQAVRQLAQRLQQL